ncbi:MAG: aldo/keto reductase [Ruminococcus sp.]|nr:aldo/keto reductase [Ruminococcus sp.]
MFKKILTLSTALLTFCGCTAKENISGSTVSTAKTASYATDNSESYTIEDLEVLQDFLLGRRTDVNGKDFDLCKDGKLDVFDMCLLRNEVIGNTQENPESDILVTYFSCTGNTEQIAEYAIDYLKADSYEIIPEIPYTEDDLKYYTDCRADKEQSDPTARPEISGSIKNMDDYEVIFVGYPIWHGQAPKIIYTFLESYDFSDKIIVPFCTSHSSGIGTSAENLHSLAENANWYDGMRFSGNSAETDVTEWIDSLGLKDGEKVDMEYFYITAGNTTFTAEFAENSSADAFRELLSENSLTIQMSDYGSFEKVGNLGKTLPRNDEKITTEAGDVILYQGNSITVYYDVNTWNFTRLGKIQNTTKEQLLEAFGNGDVEITFSLNKSESADFSVAEFNLESGKNQHAPMVTLNSGYQMPIAGIGTYSLKGDTCVDSVKSALSQGVRLIDTAYMYGNEKEVGQAIRESGIAREDIFVITKIYPGEQFKNPEKAIQEALDKLNIDYIDMMLLHHPGDNDVNAYLAMEKLVEQGKIRSLGLSNWYIEEIDDFISQVNIKPALVQNEIHPYYQERKVIEYMHSLGIVMQAWYPLGGRGHTSELLSDETITEIAEAHNKSSAQVILRWDLQNGVVVIPGSSNPEHILENISIFDFSLTDKEMAKIDALNRDEKHDWY